MENHRGNAEKAARWKGLIGEQRKSGMTIVAFCEKEDLTVGQFHWWNRRLRESGEKRTGGGFVELVAPVAGADFSGVELRVNAHVSIRLARGFNPETLKIALATIGANAE